MKILTVIGTRPEVIKLSPILREFNKRGGVQSVVCVTGQHREMLDTALEVFNIKPHYDLDVMSDNQPAAEVASEVMSRLDTILQIEKPDWVIVQGDTTTTAAAALCAFYRRIAVGHVEAGLRTFDKWRPFPEEINRRLTTISADRHFAPTHRAKQNLINEGVSEQSIVVTGNPVIDSLQWVAELVPTPQLVEFCSGLEGRERRLILVTAHRRENWGSPLENVCLALRDVVEAYNGKVHVVYPVHLNPNVFEPVHRLLDGVANVTLVKPVDYLTLVHLMRRAWIVATDSGGIQEEAPSLGKPVFVLRDVTERPEAVEAGIVRVIGTDRNAIVNEITCLLDDEVAYARMSRAVNVYGDGRASERITAALLGERYTEFHATSMSHGQATVMNYRATEQCLETCRP